jgi:hypothetical protein
VELAQRRRGCLGGTCLVTISQMNMAAAGSWSSARGVLSLFA